MSDKTYEIPADWSKRAFIDDAKYRAMYERSIKDPNGFWGEENDVPVLRFYQIAKLFRALSGRIKAAYQAAHAGARKIVDRNVVIFEPLEYPDMRQSESAAAFERDSDLQAWPGGRWSRSRRHRGSALNHRRVLRSRK